VIIVENKEKSLTSTSINWYPGHMAKAKRIIKENIDMVDIVYEVIDARIPATSKMQDMDNIIKDKERVLIMTKSDLCDLEETNKWVKFYEKKGYHVLLLDLTKNQNLNKVFELTNTLMEEINSKRKAKGMKERKARVLIIGIPNVGKSTLINRLVNKKATNVGNKPGITKKLEWIRINENVELLDSPGILWPKFKTKEEAYNLGAMTAIKEEILPLDEISIHILKKLEKYYPNLLEKRYGIKKIDKDIEVTLTEIGKKRGCLVKGGEVDYDKVYSVIINDMMNGKIGKVTFDRK